MISGETIVILCWKHHLYFADQSISIHLCVLFIACIGEITEFSVVFFFWGPSFKLLFCVLFFFILLIWFFYDRTEIWSTSYKLWTFSRTVDSISFAKSVVNIIGNRWGVGWPVFLKCRSRIFTHVHSFLLHTVYNPMQYI